MNLTWEHVAPSRWEADMGDHLYTATYMPDRDSAFAQSHPWVGRHQWPITQNDLMIDDEVATRSLYAVKVWAQREWDSTTRQSQQS